MSILIGLLIGALLGLTGAGGSIFAVPLLILLLGLPANDAMAIALAAVAASALIGVVVQRRSVLWWPALFLAAGGMLSAPLGKCLAGKLDENWLIAGFSLLAISIAIRMLRQVQTDPASTSHVRAASDKDTNGEQAMACRMSPSGQFQLKPRCISGLLIGGLSIGLASGLFGVGGGFLIVPLFLFLSAIPMQRAVATSLASIVLISSAGFISHVYFEGSKGLVLALPIIAAAIAGMLASVGFARFIAGPALQKGFACLLILVSLVLAAKQFVFS
ncbi:sulfite exporter TauE/SafE family protein [Agaribacterium haliotis]|uniref:sulfite exporter TauE/SafE family protein n=1 Tax=Agaribacterium haliotis TaxID=2013869 RepID=UPI000BB56146|nr:sulfite exporter TauE/SafE family protein [Agaribacterium haliotis]